VVAVAIFGVIALTMEAKNDTFVIIIGLAVILTTLNFADYYKYKKRHENKNKNNKS
jgi:uncharacterized membrane protein YuzA (DUF378 family)